MNLTEQDIVRQEAAGVLLYGYKKTLDIYKHHLEKEVPEDDKPLSAWQAASRSMLSHIAILLKLLEALNKTSQKSSDYAQKGYMDAALDEVAAFERSGEYALIGEEEFI